MTLSGCEFAQVDQAGAADLNSCAVSDDCGSDGECVGGMCVANEAEMPLSVLLEVTPVRRMTEDGASPPPVLLRTLEVTGPMDEPIEVPRPDRLVGSVRDGQRALDAEVRFTPLSTLPGVLDPSVSVTTAGFQTDDEFDFGVELSRGVDYRVVVRPTNGEYPPFRTTLRAGGAQPLEIDYNQNPANGAVTLPLRTQVVRIAEAPDDRVLIVRAFDASTGEPVSSTEQVVDGEVALLFAPDTPPWRLEIRAEQSYAPTHGVEAGALGCDEDTPVYPVFSALQENLAIEDDGAIELALPEPPPRIRYEGTVAVCPQPAARPVEVTELSMTLRSSTLLLDEPDGLTASFDATTAVRFDEQSGSLRFCVQLMEGEYDVVVTPPAETGCGLFAERRLIKAPDDVAATGALLELHRSAWLQGKLKTRELQPLAGATVDAIAQARDHSVMLADDDPSVTRYNRSQQTTSDDSGAFRVAVDLGSYDVIVKAPSGSGYPWLVRHDVGIGARGVEFPTVIDMLAPITLQGSLGYPGDETDLEDAFADAEVSAFAVLDEGTPGARVVPIGKTVADAEGRFMLLLPPSLQRGW